MRSRNQIVALIAILPLSGVCLAVPGDEDAPGQLEEVVVTSRRVEESLQRAPVAVTAVTGAQLEASNITNLNEISELAPNIDIKSANGFANTISPYIRGLGTIETDPSFDPAVAVVVDGFYMSGINGSVPDLFDIDRIEILRGPQGTTFGRNSLAGAINIVTAAPTGEFDIKAAVTIGQFGQRDASARIDFPITGNISGKVSIQETHLDGYGTHTLVNPVTSAVGPTFESGKIDNLTIRPALLFKINDSAKITLRGEFAHFDDPAGNQEFAPPGLLGGPTGTFPAFPGAGFTYLIAAPVAAGGFGVANSPNPLSLTNSAFSNSINVAPRSDLKAQGVYLNGDFGLGVGKLSMDVGYRKYDYSWLLDTDASAANVLNYGSHEYSTERNADVRYTSPIEWLSSRSQFLAGFFYLKDDFTDKNEINGDALGVPGPIGVIGGAAQKRTSYAPYLSVDWAFAEQWTLTLGGRYSYEKKDFTFADPGTCSSTALGFTDCNALLTPFTASKSWQDFAPKATLDYQVTNDLMLYALFSTAYQSGGFVGRSFSRTAIGPYQPEKVHSFEVGAKSEFFDRRLRLDVAAFYNKYNDLQTDTVGLGGASVVSNAAKATVKGAEFELTAIPLAAIPKLRILSSIGLLDAKYNDYVADITGSGIPINLDSTQFIRAPKFTASVAPSYGIDTAIGEVRLQMDYAYKSKEYLSQENFAYFISKAEGTLNASIGLTQTLYGGNRLGITAIGENLTDVLYVTAGNSALPLLASGTVSPPRRFSVRINYDFGGH